MLGIQDPWVLLAYVLCIVSTILCVVYGVKNRNRGDESVEPDDVRWAAKEKEVEDKL